MWSQLPLYSLHLYITSYSIAPSPLLMQILRFSDSKRCSMTDGDAIPMSIEFYFYFDEEMKGIIERIQNNKYIQSLSFKHVSTAG